MDESVDQMDEVFDKLVLESATRRKQTFDDIISKYENVGEGSDEEVVDLLKMTYVRKKKVHRNKKKKEDYRGKPFGSLCSYSVSEQAKEYIEQISKYVEIHRAPPQGARSVFLFDENYSHEEINLSPIESDSSDETLPIVPNNHNDATCHYSGKISPEAFASYKPLFKNVPLESTCGKYKNNIKSRIVQKINCDTTHHYSDKISASKAFTSNEPVFKNVPLESTCEKYKKITKSDSFEKKSCIGSPKLHSYIPKLSICSITEFCSTPPDFITINRGYITKRITPQKLSAFAGNSNGNSQFPIVLKSDKSKHTEKEILGSSASPKSHSAIMKQDKYLSAESSSTFADKEFLTQDIIEQELNMADNCNTHSEITIKRGKSNDSKGQANKFCKNRNVTEDKSVKKCEDLLAKNSSNPDTEKHLTEKTNPQKLDVTEHCNRVIKQTSENHKVRCFKNGLHKNSSSSAESLFESTLAEQLSPQNANEAADYNNVIKKTSKNQNLRCTERGIQENRVSSSEDLIELSFVNPSPSKQSIPHKKTPSPQELMSQKLNTSIEANYKIVGTPKLRRSTRIRKLQEIKDLTSKKQRKCSLSGTSSKPPSVIQKASSKFNSNDSCSTAFATPKIPKNCKSKHPRIRLRNLSVLLERVPATKILDAVNGITVPQKLSINDNSCNVKVPTKSRKLYRPKNQLLQPETLTNSEDSFILSEIQPSARMTSVRRKSSTTDSCDSVMEKTSRRHSMRLCRCPIDEGKDFSLESSSSVEAEKLSSSKHSISLTENTHSTEMIIPEKHFPQPETAPNAEDSFVLSERRPSTRKASVSKKSATENCGIVMENTSKKHKAKLTKHTVDGGKNISQEKPSSVEAKILSSSIHSIPLTENSTEMIIPENYFSLPEIVPNGEDSFVLRKRRPSTTKASVPKKSATENHGTVMKNTSKKHKVKLTKHTVDVGKNISQENSSSVGVKILSSSKHSISLTENENSAEMIIPENHFSPPQTVPNAEDSFVLSERRPSTRKASVPKKSATENCGTIMENTSKTCKRKVTNHKVDEAKNISPKNSSSVEAKILSSSEHSIKKKKTDSTETIIPWRRSSTNNSNLISTTRTSYRNYSVNHPEKQQSNCAVLLKHPSNVIPDNNSESPIFPSVEYRNINAGKLTLSHECSVDVSPVFRFEKLKPSRDSIGNRDKDNSGAITPKTSLTPLPKNNSFRPIKGFSNRRIKYPSSSEPSFVERYPNSQGHLSSKRSPNDPSESCEVPWNTPKLTEKPKRKKLVKKMQYNSLLKL